MSKLSKIVVFGGNGFLGRRICENAIQRGFQVTSVSQSGKKPENVTDSDKEWVQKVNWTKGDVFRPETYTDKIKDAVGVVHSIGILLENQNYKKVVGSTDDAFGILQSLFTQPSGNPMKKVPKQERRRAESKENVKEQGKEEGASDKSKKAAKAAPAPTKDSVDEDAVEEDENPVIDVTYERMNKESALVLADALISCNKNKPAFVYVSADRGFPGFPSEYIETKRQAEYELYQLQPEIRPILMRPGFMYDENAAKDGGVRSILKKGLDIANAVNDKVLMNALDGIVRPPISTQNVARWVVDKIEDGDFRGPVLMDEMLNVRRGEKGADEKGADEKGSDEKGSE
ncbi:DEKNAAC102939 [Brettanomyces naardenensis]|uniref:DEKNAAC102939 n=1 Tax=Brettanomyces naardenensis TaxID=13370 RepID=A0A448YM26_BRENA|nr:DEKNAAC102939 [Brettanomyces naardenensis]